MKKGAHKYYYKKVIKGIGQFGMVKVEVRLAETESKIIDNCKWKELKESYSEFEELDILKLWKNSAINAAQSIINTSFFAKKVDIIIHDISGTYVDTTPSNIGAAMFIAVFDLIGAELSLENINIIDDFVVGNKNNELIPDFQLINLDLQVLL